MLEGARRESLSAGAQTLAANVPIIGHSPHIFRAIRTIDGHSEVRDRANSAPAGRRSSSGVRFARTIATSPRGLMVREARRRAPHHEGLGPHPGEPAFAGVSKDGAMAACVFTAAPQPAVDRAEHIAIIVGPDPLLLVGLGQLPLLG